MKKAKEKKPMNVKATIFINAVAIRGLNRRVTVSKHEAGFTLHFEKMLSIKEMLKAAKNNQKISTCYCTVKRGKLSTTVDLSDESMAFLLEAYILYRDRIATKELKK